MAGKVVYAKSVLTTLPLYAMQTVLLPTSICQRLDAIIRDFIWGTTAESKKWHLVKWEDITRPPSNDGLGITTDHERNIVHLATTCWHLHQEDEGLWAQLIRSKYNKQHQILHIDQTQFTRPSTTWRALLAGNTISFWSDSWTHFGKLSDIVTQPLSRLQTSKPVADYLYQGCWKVHDLQLLLPPNVIQAILPIHAVSNGVLQDRPIWRQSGNGEFTVASMIKARFANQPKWAGDFIWKIPLLPHTHLFLWQLLHERLLTNQYQFRCNATISATCGLCQDPNETIEHVFHSCLMARKVWSTCTMSPQIWQTFHLHFRDWLTINLKDDRLWYNGIQWRSFFAFILWFIWK